MDFSAWFEVYLGDRWYTFDARHNKPRIGHILMARGRDATDVAIVTSFGPCTLAGFKVITDEVTSVAPASTVVAFATGSDTIFPLLQRDAHALGVGQGRAATTSRPTIWDHC
jgi:transglutaminase-like putative cysteine protease